MKFAAFLLVAFALLAGQLAGKQLESQPEMVAYAFPAYPQAAVKARMHGTVLVEILIRIDGTSEVLATSGPNPLLTNRAAQAAGKFVFQSPEFECTSQLQFDFLLDESIEGVEERMVSLSHFQVAACPPPPSPGYICRLPRSQPSYISSYPWGYSFDGELLAHLPLQ